MSLFAHLPFCIAYWFYPDVNTYTKCNEGTVLDAIKTWYIFPPKIDAFFPESSPPPYRYTRNESSTRLVARPKHNTRRDRCVFRLSGVGASTCLQSWMASQCKYLQKKLFFNFSFFRLLLLIFLCDILFGAIFANCVRQSIELWLLSVDFSNFVSLSESVCLGWCSRLYDLLLVKVIKSPLNCVKCAFSFTFALLPLRVPHYIATTISQSRKNNMFFPRSKYVYMKRASISAHPPDGMNKQNSKERRRKNGSRKCAHRDETY